MINFCIFEDEFYKNLLPLTDCKPACDLLVGINTLLDKISHYYNHGNISIQCRSHLKFVLKKKYPNLSINTLNYGAPCFFINARLIIEEHLYTIFDQIDEKHNYLYTYNNQVVATYLRGSLLTKMGTLLETIPSPSKIIKEFRKNCITKELDSVKMLTNIEDIIHFNPHFIHSDFKQKGKFGIIKGEFNPFSVIYNEENVFIEEESQIEDFVLLNAKNGPIYIDRGVVIQAQSRIEGPVYIGKNTTIFGGGVKSSSIGESCKISGDVSNSIIQGFSNKAHEGFIGHSYIGEWVNLGAGTTTSNLKVNYKPIKIVQNNQINDTKSLFLGSIIGDYVKTAIGVKLNAGTIIHTGSILLDTLLDIKEYPPFSWGNPTLQKKIDIKKLIETTHTVYKRRNKKLNDREAELLTHLFEHYNKKYESIHI